MAATFEWQEANGAGETVTTPTNVNHKNIDDSTSAYGSFPITDWNNSFEKWQFGKFSWTYNQISAWLYAHTAGAFGTGLTLKGQTSMTVDGDKETYTTPATTANANLSVDMTSVTAIGSWQAVWFSWTDQNAVKTTTTTTNPWYTNYLTTQLQTSGAGAWDTTSVTLTLQYDEN